MFWLKGGLQAGTNWSSLARSPSVILNEECFPALAVRR